MSSQSHPMLNHSQLLTPPSPILGRLKYHLYPKNYPFLSLKFNYDVILKRKTKTKRVMYI